MSTSIIEDVVSFTVPLTPPSVNHMKVPCVYTDCYGHRKRGMKLTPEAKAFKFAVAIFAKGRTITPATAKERDKVRYSVIIDVYLGPRQRLDADNGNKLCIDGLEEAGVIHSDAFVGQQLTRTHKDDRANPRTEFIVSRMEN